MSHPATELRSRRGAILSLMLIQFVTAINWFAPNSTFSLIASDFGEDLSGLGVLVAAFMLGVALFQLVGGSLAFSRGAKRTLVAGSLVFAVATLLCSLTGNIASLTFLRFIAGVGEALVFPPSAMLIARYSSGMNRGTVFGVFTAAFWLGGFVGTSGWASLSAIVGWRASLATGGALGLAETVLLFVMLPRDPGLSSRPAGIASELRKVVFNRSLLFVGLASMALQVGLSLEGNFMVYYLESHLSYDANLAGLVGGAALAASLVGALLGGKIAGSRARLNVMLLAMGLVSAGGVWALSTSYSVAPVISCVIVGFFGAAGVTIGLVCIRGIAGERGEAQTFGFAWINTMTLLFTSIVPIAFSSLAVSYDYPLAWSSAAILVVLLSFAALGIRVEEAGAKRIGSSASPR